MGILSFKPLYQTRTWQMADIDTSLAIGGAKLPFETYFTYGVVQFSNPPMPPADRAPPA